MGAGARPFLYDVTRLVTRGLNAAPNGIDRIDFVLARHFLEKGATPLVATALGPRLSDAKRALTTLASIGAHWREDEDPARDEVYRAVVSALADDRAAGPPRVIRKRKLDDLARPTRAILDWGLPRGLPATEAPRGAVYFTATQFLLDRPWHVRWLEARRDVKPAAFVHDLLPLDHPEFFRRREALLHPRRLDALCRFGAGAIVASNAVGQRFRAFSAGKGRGDLPVCVARPPVQPIFAQEAPPPPELAGVAYFVTCGTIEPRKNHRLLLDVWRELAQEAGAPKLVVVGKRGWLNETVVDPMTRSPALRAHVVEANGLSTPGLRRLLAGARALLAPSLAEGFGLPLAEALVAGTPVICSDIDVFREVAGARPDYIHPLDGLGWLQAIKDYAAPHSSRRAEALGRLAREPFAAGEDFAEQVESFLAAL